MRTSEHDPASPGGSLRVPRKLRKAVYQGISKIDHCAVCEREAARFLMSRGPELWWQCSDCGHRTEAADTDLNGADQHNHARGCMCHLDGTR